MSLEAKFRAQRKRIAKTLKAKDPKRQAKLVAMYDLKPQDFLPQYGGWQHRAGSPSRAGP